MGLFGLMEKAAIGTVKLVGKGATKLVGEGAKLAGKGVKMAGSAIGKEAKSIGKDLAKSIKNKAHNSMEEVVAEIKEEFDLEEDVKTSKKDKNKSLIQKETILIENKQSQNKKVLATSYEEQIHALKELNELLKEGIITQQEFDLKKKEILGI